MPSRRLTIRPETLTAMAQSIEANNALYRRLTAPRNPERIQGETVRGTWVDEFVDVARYAYQGVDAGRDSAPSYYVRPEPPPIPTEGVPEGHGPDAPASPTPYTDRLMDYIGMRSQSGAWRSDEPIQVTAEVYEGVMREMPVHARWSSQAAGVPLENLIVAGHPIHPAPETVQQVSQYNYAIQAQPDPRVAPPPARTAQEQGIIDMIEARQQEASRQWAERYREDLMQALSGPDSAPQPVDGYGNEITPPTPQPGEQVEPSWWATDRPRRMRVTRTVHKSVTIHEGLQKLEMVVSNYKEQAA